jgi:hypothetical protein
MPSFMRKKPGRVLNSLLVFLWLPLLFSQSEKKDGPSSLSLLERALYLMKALNTGGIDDEND